MIAGEASGDLHGSNLAKALFLRSKDHEIQGWGGDLMASSGVEILSHYKDRALMGFIEVLLNWRKIRKWFKQCKKQIAEFKPDVLVLIDYGGFNLRMAKIAHKQGIRVHYYIPPKVWAWNRKRVKKLKAYTDSVSCILPFEEEWFAAHGVNARYVGNPLMKTIAEHEFDAAFTERNNIRNHYIALLPGSRLQEISRILPEMILAGRQIKGYDLVLACAPGIPMEFYSNFSIGNIKLIKGSTYDILKNCDGAIVTSGTATLETALLNVPQVVVYKANPMSFFIGKLLIKVSYISLVNLILKREAVSELIQNEAIALHISNALARSMNNADLLDDYRELRMLISDRDASTETAERILAMV